MVAGCGVNNRLLERVAEIYDWLHSQIRRHGDLAGLCDVCGKCCDFDSPALASEQELAAGCDEGFDHRLFVTPPELMYLAANLGAENIKGSHFASPSDSRRQTGLRAIRRKMGPRPMPTSRCPYNIGGKCTVYEYRFAGCRIFCCNGDADFQSRLSESALKKLKSICTEFQIPYRYTDLASALNSLADA